MRKVFLDDLPRWRFGEFKYNGEIDWKNSIGYKIKFTYDDVKGIIEIVNYIKFKKRNPIIIVKYNDKEFKISPNRLRNNELGKLLGLITSEFKIEIGTRFQDDKRDITIIDRRKIKNKRGQWKKHYRYKCNKCGFDGGKHWSIKDKEHKNEFWIEENNIFQGKGCSCCCSNPQVVVECINSIVAREETKWMISYFQGGYDEAKLYTKNSIQKIIPICPDCGRVKNKSITIGSIYKNHSIGCICSDGIKYPEKFMYIFLKQLDLDFKTQLTREMFEWINTYRYDFYFEYNNEQYIVETHGKQHYEERTGNWRMSLEEIQKNDKLKKNLALNNGIKEENYIVINCRYSELEWMRDNDDGILNSKLNKLFDLAKIDWIKCGEFACSNLVKIACEYKKNNSDWTTGDIAKIMGYSQASIRNWLKKGCKLEWCIYNAKKEKEKITKNVGKKYKEKYSKPIKMFDAEMSIVMMFLSANVCERESEKLFGIKLNHSNISAVCNGKVKTHKGYIFQHATKEEYKKWVLEQNKINIIHNENLGQAI